MSLYLDSSKDAVVIFVDEKTGSKPLNVKRIPSLHCRVNLEGASMNTQGLNYHWPYCCPGKSYLKG